MYKDLVKCNNCSAESLVDRDEDTCPVCKHKGGLTDIEQDVEV